MKNLSSLDNHQPLASQLLNLNSLRQVLPRALPAGPLRAGLAALLLGYGLVIYLVTFSAFVSHFRFCHAPVSVV